MKKLTVFLTIFMCLFLSSTVCNADGRNPYDDRATVCPNQTDPYAPTNQCPTPSTDPYSSPDPYPPSNTDPYGSTPTYPPSQTDPYSTPNYPSSQTDPYATNNGNLSILANSPDWKVRLSVARNPTTPVSLLLRLSNDSDSDVRDAVSIHPILTSPLTSTSDLDMLGTSNNWKVRRAVARHSNTSASTLLRLSNDSDSDIRDTVCLHPIFTSPLTSSSDLDSFSYSSNWKVRRAVARHPNTTAGTLLRLSNDDDTDIRATAAIHPILTSPLSNSCDLNLLSTSGNWKVRLAVARHRNTSRSTLLDLINDSDGDVRRAANNSLMYR
ncbi:MAG: hypothetical protein HQM10_14415 [Candidatus Riflebacteria bacterium]|nr:hypothetical protein [Candidatus Riflebacteria bacterium]